MNKQTFKTVTEVWAAIDAGKTVYWGNKEYRLTEEDSNLEWRLSHGYEAPLSNRNGRCLRVTCTRNWFGSFLTESDINELFVEEV
jgi:hypothetical protein